jgi:uncharacterized protein YqgC (DUF456 family)
MTTTRPPAADVRATRPSRLGVWSVACLAAYVPWLVGAVFLMPGGEQPFGETVEGTEWLAWAAMSLVAVLPLLVAAVLGWLGVRRGAGLLAWIGAVAGTVGTLLFGVLPAFGWM